MLAEIIGSGERIFEIELAIDGLRHLIGGKKLSARTICAGRQASGKEQDQPIPVEDLRPNNEEHNRTAQRDNGRERHRVDEQMQGLTVTATPDQVMQRATLVSHLTTLSQTRGWELAKTGLQRYECTPVRPTAAAAGA